VTAGGVHAALVAALEACELHAEELGQLDSVAGDGDHGSGMVRGFKAASSVTAELACSSGEAIVIAGTAFADAAGGASGALWGVLLRSVGTSLGTGEVTSQSIATALRAGENQVARVGKAQLGDKTLLDTLTPFLDHLDTSLVAGTGLRGAWAAALQVAREATEGTAKMVAKKGRSSVLGDRSLGTVDPGARSLLLVLEAVVNLLPDVGPESAQ
jgi:dihydroxyacetone kinase